MRTNVYSQEINLDPREVQLVTQTADNGIVYYGVRMFLHSTNRLHDVPGDDDRSAITYWLPRTTAKREMLSEVFVAAADLVLVAPPETGAD